MGLGVLQELPLGIRFSERMAGSLVLDQTDPRTAAVSGQSAPSVMTLHATITIPNLRAFIADPTHTGMMSGAIDFAPMAANMLCMKGVFRLFTPSGVKGLRWMVYEMGFAHDGSSYYLAGKKEVRAGSIFRLWSDTTTLFCYLHRGTETSGEIAGAGILRLGLGDFMRLLATLRTVGARKFMDRLIAPTVFGWFFVQALWTTYVLRR